MPRDGSGVYSLPPGTKGVTDTTIESTKYNSFTADVERYLNEPTPIIAGGTGANSAKAARDNIDAEVAMQQITNFDSTVWEPGSFYAISSATGSPVAGHAFIGQVIGTSTIPGGHIIVTATDLNDGLNPHTEYVRYFNGTTWGSWYVAQSGQFVAKSGDTMTGDLIIGNATARAMLTINGNVGTGTGSLMGFYTGGVPRYYLGNYSAILGGAENNDLLLWVSGATSGPAIRVNSGTGATTIGAEPFVIKSDTPTHSRIELRAAATGTTAITGYKADKARWSIQPGDSIAEGGGNSGSNFSLYRYDDAGNMLGGSSIFNINRSTGIAQFNGQLLVGNELWTYGYSGDTAKGVVRFNAGGSSYQLFENGGFTLSHPTNVAGQLTSTTGRLMSIRSGAGQEASVGVWSQSHGAYAMFADNSGRLAWGQCDGTGAPVNNRMNLDGNAVLTANAFTGLYGVNQFNYNDANWTVIVKNTHGSTSANGLYTQVANDNAFSLAVMNAAGNAWAHIFNGSGRYEARDRITSLTGYTCRAGTFGATGNVFNYFWNNAMQVWVDASNVGNMNITSDYRTKKDVADLGSTWDTVKTLRPIKYTQAQFSPPSHIAFHAAEALKAREQAEKNGEPVPPEAPPAPLFEADDIERWGFIAHELQEALLPSAAEGEKDSPNTVQSLNLAPIVAALTKALQEAMARIEALEAKLATA